MANPKLCPLARHVLTPISSPRRVINGLPLLPPEIAAVVWTHVASEGDFSSSAVRPSISPASAHGADDSLSYGELEFLRMADGNHRIPLSDDRLRQLKVLQVRRATLQLQDGQIVVEICCAVARKR